MPSFSFHQFYCIYKELREYLLHSRLRKILPLPHNEWIFCFEKKNLFLSFRSPYSRLHLTERTEKNNFSPFFFLINSTLLDLKILQEDRILQFTFSKEGSQHFLIGEFFDKHPNLYLTDEKNTIVWSLYPLKKTHYTPPSHAYTHSTDTSCMNSRELEAFYLSLEASETLEKERFLLSQILLKKQKKWETKKEVFKKDLVQALDWKKVEHLGHLFKTSLGLFKKGQLEVEIQDWETDQTLLLRLEKNRSPQEQMELLFRRSKKLKKSILPLQNQIEEIENKLVVLSTLFHQLSLCSTVEEVYAIQKRLEQPSQKKEKKVAAALPYYSYLSEKGDIILVGKNARSNHSLTFKHAHGNDWWLHVKDYPGSHVIIKVQRNTALDQETLLDAMQLALHYSKANKEKGADVSWTRKKYLSPMKGSTQGIVQISKHNTKWVANDPERLAKIEERLKKAKRKDCFFET